MARARQGRRDFPTEIKVILSVALTYIDYSICIHFDVATPSDGQFKITTVLTFDHRKVWQSTGNRRQQLMAERRQAAADGLKEIGTA